MKAKKEKATKKTLEELAKENHCPNSLYRSFDGSVFDSAADLVDENGDGSTVGVYVLVAVKKAVAGEVVLADL